MFCRVKEWLERFTADEPTPEEIMEIRAREGTLLDDLRDAKEGARDFFRELTEPDENDYIYDELPEVEEDWLEKWMKEEEEDLLINPAYGDILGNIHHDYEHWKWHHDD